MSVRYFLNRFINGVRGEAKASSQTVGSVAVKERAAAFRTRGMKGLRPLDFTLMSVSKSFR